MRADIEEIRMLRKME